MHKLTINLTALASLIILFSGCEFICDCEDDGLEPCTFSYEQAAYTPDGAAGDQLVSPVFEGDIPEGTFSATPDGLAIDPKTGVIDVNASEFGKEYTVKFRIEESEVVCETNIFIDESNAQPCDLNYETNVAIPGQMNILEPKFGENTELDGTFTAIPPGLDINPESGVISVNTSEAGVEYRIMYTSQDKNTMCETTMLVSGIDYLDVIIDLESNEPDSIFPILDANPEQRAPQGKYDADGRARLQGLSIDPDTGAINLLQTLQQVNDLRQEREEEPNENGLYIDDGEKLEFTFAYIVGNPNVDTDVLATQEVVIYWFEKEVSEEIRKLVEEKSLYPINGREMSPPPLMVARGSFVR